MIFFGKGITNGGFHGGQMNGDQIAYGVFPADGPVSEPFGQGQNHAGGHGGDKADPVGGKPDGHQGHPDDGARKPPDPGVHSHQIRITEDLRPPNVQRTAGGFRRFQTSAEISQNIVDRDGLGFGINPPGAEENRQPVPGIPQPPPDK